MKSRLVRIRNKLSGVNRKVLTVAILIPVFILSGIIGLSNKPESHAASGAPASPTPVCGTSVLNSPYSYNGAAGTYTTSGSPAGLPTFGAAGTDFPTATKIVVIPAGNNSAAAGTGTYEPSNVIYYFEPGTHQINGMYTGHDSVYIGGYNASAGKAIIDGVDGATGGTGKGGNILSVAKPSSGNVVNATWEYLTIKNFASNENNSVMGNVNGGDSDIGDTYKYDTIGPNFGYTGDTTAPVTGESSGGGYAIDMSDNTTVQYNCLTQNPQGGFNGGGYNINISNNEISKNGLGEYPDTDGPGASPHSCGCSGGGKLFFSTNATIDNNYIHDNYNTAIWLDFDNTGADMSYNYIANNWGSAIEYEASYNANITYNTMVGNGWASNGAWPEGVGGQPCFGNVSCTNGNGPITGNGGGNPYAAIYLPNTGGNSNITAVKDASGTTHASRYLGQVIVHGNNLVNNFGGVDVYTDTDRFPDGINNDSACSYPLNGGDARYYRQTKYLSADTVNISGAAVTVASPGTETLCGDYDSGVQGDPGQDIQPHAPAVGMGVYDVDANTFLGNIATVTSGTSFTLDRSPGNKTGARLLMSAYGGCGPADYFGGAQGVNSGSPSLPYWDNCIWGSRNVTVTGNTFTMDASVITGCTTANMCGYNMARAFNAGVPDLVQYFQSYSNNVAHASGGLGNVFSNNTYSWTGGGPGGWQFQAGLQSNQVSRATWQAAPNGQDANSTFGTTPPSAKVGDFNGDNSVNITDMSMLLTAWGTSNSTILTNLNQTGTVNITCLSIFLSHWGT